MEKAEAKALTSAILTLAKAQESKNKNDERIIRQLSDINESLKEIRTRYLTLSTSIDKLSENLNK